MNDIDTPSSARPHGNFDAWSYDMAGRMMPCTDKETKPMDQGQPQPTSAPISTPASPAPTPPTGESPTPAESTPPPVPGSPAPDVYSELDYE
jgi:hypothetical protein